MRYLFLILYLAILISLGIFHAFRRKSEKDFYVAGKNTGVLGVSGSLIATILGSSAILGTVNLSWEQGWASSWILLSAVLGLAALIPLSSFVRRFGRFTLPQMLGDFYGKRAYLISSIIIPIAWIGIIAAQVIGAAKILGSFFDIDYTMGVILCGVVFVFYTIAGGQLSIIKTDVIQAMFVIVGVLITFIFCFYALETPVWEMKVPSFPFNEHFDLLDLLVLIITYSTTYFVGPDVYSRLFCAKNEKVARKSVIITALVMIPFAFILSFLGVFALLKYPHLEIHNVSALVHLVLNVLPEWAIGLMIAALLSAIMSSADTTLLTASAIVSGLFYSDMNHVKSVRITRLLILVFGILAIGFALKISSIISALLLATTVFSGAFIIPTAAGLLGYRCSSMQSSSSMIVGGVIALTGKIIALNGSVDLGNTLIIVAFILNAMILFFPFRKKVIVNDGKAS
ncbi:MAG: sodium:solute symporter [Bacteroidales bacterium]